MAPSDKKELGIEFVAYTEKFLTDLNKLKAQLEEFAKSTDKLSKSMAKAGDDSTKSFADTSKAAKEAAKAAGDFSKATTDYADKATKSQENVSNATKKNAVSNEALGMSLKEARTQLEGLNASQQAQIYSSAKSKEMFSAVSSELKKFAGSSWDARTALFNMAKDSDNNVMRFKQLSGSLEKVEKSILQTKSAMVESGKMSEVAANSWAKGTDRIAASQAFLNGEMFKSGDVLMSATKSFVGLGKETEVLATKYSRLIESGTVYATQARDLIEKSKNTTDGFRLLGTQLDNVNKAWKESTVGMDAWNKASEKAGSSSKASGSTIMMLNEEIKKGNINYKEATAKLAEHTTSLAKAGQATSGLGQFLQGLTGKLTGTASAAGQAAGFFTNLGHAVGSLAAWIPAAMIIGGLTEAVYASIHAIVAFDQSLKSLQAISGGTEAEISLLGKEILHVSNTTKFSAEEIAKGAIFIAQAGFSAAESLEVIGAAARGAQATLEPLATAADLLTTIIRAFKLEASSASTVMDMLAMAANQSKTNLEGMRTIFNYIGPSAQSLKISLAETLGALMALANVGIKMSTIGTGLRQVFNQLAAPSAKLSMAIDKAKLSSKDFNFEQLGMVKVLENLSKIIKTSADGIALFGQRAGQQAWVLASMHEHVAIMTRYTLEYGAAAIMAGKQTEGLSVKLDILGNKFINAFVRFSQGGLTDTFKAFIDLLTKGADLLGTTLNNSVVKTIASIALLIASLVLLNKARIALFAWTGITAIFEGVVVAVQACNVAFFVAAGRSGVLAGAITWLASVFKVLWTVIMQNKILALIVVVSSLAIAFYEWSKSTERNSLALQEEAIKLHQLSESAGEYSKKLAELAVEQAGGKNITQDYFYVLEAIKRTMPELTNDMIKNAAAVEKVKDKLLAQALVLEKAAAGYQKLADKKALKVIEDIVKAHGKETDVLKEANPIMEENISLTMEQIKTTQEAASAIANMSDETKKLALAELSDDAFGKHIKDMVKMTELVKQSYLDQGKYATTAGVDAIDQLGALWTKYYNSLSYEGQVAAEKQAITDLAAAKRFKAAKLKELGDIQDAEKLAEEATLEFKKTMAQKHIEEEQKKNEKIGELIDKYEKERLAKLRKRTEDELANNKMQESMEIAQLHSRLGDEEVFQRQKTEIEEKYASKSLEIIEREKKEALESNASMLKAELMYWEDRKREGADVADYISAANKTAADRDVATLHIVLEEYKKAYDVKIGLANKARDAELAALKAVADAEEKKVSNKKDMVKLRSDIAQLTMTDDQKVEDNAKQVQQSLDNGWSAYYNALNAGDTDSFDRRMKTVDSYASDIKGMINNIVVSNKNANGVMQKDDYATQQARTRLADQLEGLLNAQDETKIKKAKELANAAHEANKQALEIAKELKKGYDEVTIAKDKAFNIKDAVDKVELELKRLVGPDKWKIILNFKGKASPEASITDTISEITKMLSNLATDLEDLEVVISFMSEMDDEIVPLSDVLEKLKVFVASVKTFIDETPITLNVTFMGHGMDSKDSFLSDAFKTIKDSFMWLVGLIKEMSSGMTNFIIAFMGNDGTGVTFLSSMITSVGTKMSVLSAQIKALVTTFTITTVYKTEGNPTPGTPTPGTPTPTGNSPGGYVESGGFAETAGLSAGLGAAEGGVVPGTGEGDSVSAMLTPGEFVVRKAAVRNFGEGFFHMVNRMKSFSVPKFNMGGLVPSYNQGGLVNSHEVFTLNLQVGSAKLPLKVAGNPNAMRQQIKMFEKELSRMRLVNG